MITVFAFLIIALTLSIAMNIFLISKVYNTKLPNIKISKTSFKLPTLNLPKKQDKKKKDSNEDESTEEDFNPSEYLDLLADSGDLLVLLSDKSTKSKPLKCYKLIDKYYLILRDNTISFFDDENYILKDFNSGNLKYDSDATTPATQENIDNFLKMVLEYSE